MNQDKETLLVVEDDPLTLELITDILEGAGYLVVQGKDFSTGFAQLGARGATLGALITDNTYPGGEDYYSTGGGTALAKSAHDKFPALPVILLTGDLESPDEKRAAHKHLAGDTILRKPVDPAQLLSTINRLVVERRALEATTYSASAGAAPGRPKPIGPECAVLGF